jgi:hypothetical protein
VLNQKLKAGTHEFHQSDTLTPHILLSNDHLGSHNGLLAMASYQHSAYLHKDIRDVRECLFRVCAHLSKFTELYLSLQQVPLSITIPKAM